MGLSAHIASYAMAALAVGGLGYIGVRMSIELRPRPGHPIVHWWVWFPIPVAFGLAIIKILSMAAALGGV